MIPPKFTLRSVEKNQNHRSRWKKDLLHGSFQGFWWNNQCSCRWSGWQTYCRTYIWRGIQVHSCNDRRYLLRKVDEDNNSAFQEGSFDEGASIPSNDCMVFDPKYKDGDNRLLFSSNHSDGLHLIDLTERTVKRLFQERDIAQCILSHSVLTETRCYLPMITVRTTPPGKYLLFSPSWKLSTNSSLQLWQDSI